MKPIIKLMLCFISLCSYKTYSQCVDVYDDVNNNPYVCGTYGDANGVSNWDWEITDINDPNYCNMWYARTSSVSTKLTTMASPFVNAPTGALDLISQNQDYKKEKGWELLRRDFGCSHVTAYPYFVLYNKYTGLMRVFVYQPETQPQYSGILVQIEPTKNPWPASTSLGDELSIAPDKYLTANSSGNYGKAMVSVSEQAGSSRWCMAEFNPAFDPNIENAIYTGTGLKFTIFGVLNFNMQASIKGRSVTSSDPKVYNFSYVPSQVTTSDNQTFDFKGVGEKYTKFSKSITDVRDEIHKGAEAFFYAFPNPPNGSLEHTLKKAADKIYSITDDDSEFGSAIDEISKQLKNLGSVFKFIGGVIGLFSGSGSGKPAAMPSYTSYDLVLQGTISAKTVAQSFIIRVPGTVQTDNNNATYFKCPLGIVNIKNTPEADVVTYERLVEHTYFESIGHQFKRLNYVSYRMRNNLTLSVNDGAGLELVSAKAAIVGEILPNVNGTGSYDLLQKHNYDFPLDPYDRWICNYMLPDLENGRLKFARYDSQKGLHTFETPYVDIECLNGLCFNAVATTKVYLKIIAILKKKNDPDNTPIFYIKTYNIDTYPATISDDLRSDYRFQQSKNYLSPYTNYTELPLYSSDITIDESYSSVSNIEEKADNSIKTENTVIIYPSAQNIVFKAGGNVILNPGFEAKSGCLFSAAINNYGYNLSCNTPQIETFQYNGDCYNTTATALRTRNNNPASSKDHILQQISVYPTITNDLVNISGSDLKNASVVVTDMSGRTVMLLNNRMVNGNLQLHLNHLSNGAYVIKITSSGKTLSRKILLNK